MKHQFLRTTAALGFAAFALNAYAEQGGKGMDMGNMKMDCSKHMDDMKGMKRMESMNCMDQGSAKATSFTDGEVKNVDTKAGQVTLKHGPIENMKMPPMTMAFPVSDAAMLEKVKPGDRVKFIAEKQGAEAVITKIEVAK